MNFESIAIGALVGLVVGMASERFRASMWVRQEVYKYKRGIYEGLLRSLADYKFANNLLTHTNEELGESTRNERVQMERKAMDELTRLTPLARTILDAKALQALQTMYGSGIQASQTKDPREFRERVGSLLKTTEELIIQAARKDLRL